MPGSATIFSKKIAIYLQLAGVAMLLSQHVIGRINKKYFKDNKYINRFTNFMKIAAVLSFLVSIGGMEF